LIDATATVYTALETKRETSMGVGTREVTCYWCERCDYVWNARVENAPPPKVCPNGACKSPYWDRPRQGEDPKPPPEGVKKRRKK
jgi:hypothetical protein